MPELQISCSDGCEYERNRGGDLIMDANSTVYCPVRIRMIWSLTSHIFRNISMIY
jgi:hypothetical protein